MEQILHYVWKHRLFQNSLTTTEGAEIEVIDVGKHNTDSGPDFFNAKIKMDGQIWVGNIEIHRKSEDWYKHKHDKDDAYNSVILHVVEFAADDIRNKEGRIIPQCQIDYPIHIKDNIEYLLNADVPVACTNYIDNFPSMHMASWINTLLVERLERKADDIATLQDRFVGSWEDIFYVLLSRNFGFGLNSDAFQALALSLPLKYILKQNDNIIQIEALLFGQAGLLDNESCSDEYFKRLCVEYSFLKNKFDLNPLDASLFRRMRVRPTGSPFIRIAQLAMLLHTRQNLFSKILRITDLGQVRLLLHENASDYWQTHYSFGEESPRKSKYLGDASLDVILINTVVPILFAYGKKTDNEELCERALSFLEKIKAESNYIIRDFASAKIRVKSAYDSQALIQLRKEYCDKRKCLYCRIGYRMLSEK